MNQPTDPILIDLAKTPDFSLGPAQVRPALRAFVSGGAEEQLEPRVMQVLIALARKTGEVVSRDDLVAACWGGRVVGEDAIQRAVAKTRKLGEESGAFAIETIPRVGYRLSATAAEPAAAAAIAASTKPLLAVLPFENFSPDPDMAFFADAIADEILQTVARATQIGVISRASSFQFRGPDKAARKVAAELNATHLLDGSVRRAGDRVRISAELIETNSARAIWQDVYERPMADLLAVQEEIASQVASALGRKFDNAPPAVIDPDLYDRYLRARDAVSGRVPGQIGREYWRPLDEIVVGAPNFAPALAMAAVARHVARQSLPPNDGRADQLFDEALALARRALALDPANAVALCVLGEIEPLCGRFAAREEMFKRAMAAEPGGEIPALRYSYLLVSTGRMNEGGSFAREAYERNPLYPASSFLYGEALGNSGDFDGAMRAHEATERRWPGVTPAVYALTTRAASHGRWDIVDRYIGKMSAISSRAMRDALFSVDMYRDPTPERRALVMQDLEYLVGRRGRIPFSRIGFACRYCDIDAVYDVIDRASFAYALEPRAVMEPGDIGLHSLFNLGGAYAHRSPRFVKLCARLGLVQYWLERGVWPDCADLVRYDFRAECRKLADHPLG